LSDAYSSCINRVYTSLSFKKTVRESINSKSNNFIQIAGLRRADRISGAFGEALLQSAKTTENT